MPHPTSLPSSHPTSYPRAPVAAPLALAALLLAQPAAAADLIVRVGGIASANGEIGCALFSSPEGFPMDAARARQQWQPAQAGGVSCRFEGLAAGRYAVAVSHDLNGNHRVDTNLFGLPTEGWGVSNNVRPALRAPRFDEAAFTLAAEQALTLDVQVAR